MAEQGVSVTCEGGLDLVGTTHTLFRTPGVATTLENYESSIHGGYRRINGFSKFGNNFNTLQVYKRLLGRLLLRLKL